MLDGVVEIPLSGRPERSSLPRGSQCAPWMQSFFAGPENRLVELAVASLLNDTDDAYSPIVFCGPSGTGKSHLAWGLATAWKARFRKRAAAYIPAVDFARELADAIQTKTVDDFRLRYRRLSLLVIDDLQHLLGKLAAQRELTFTLDHLETASSRVVITANRLPAELRGLIAGLQSRLAQGLVVALARPGPQARLAILQRLANAQGIEFSDGALQVLAAGLPGTVSELLGTITQLEFSAGPGRAVIDLERVRQYVAQRNGCRQSSVSEIASVTAAYFCLRPKDLRGPSRRRPAPTARALAMYLARNLTTQNLKQIGRYFGGRDHTTVSYSCRKTEERLHTEPEIRDAVFTIQEELQRT